MAHCKPTFKKGTKAQLRKFLDSIGYTNTEIDQYINAICSREVFESAPFGVLEEAMERVLDLVHCDDDDMMDFIICKEKERLLDMSAHLVVPNYEFMSGWMVIDASIGSQYQYTCDYDGHIWFFYFEDEQPRLPDTSHIKDIMDYIEFLDMEKYEFKCLTNK